MKHTIPARPILPRSLRSSVLLLGGALAVSLLASCGRTTHSGGGYQSPSPASFVELEPNDSPLFPDFVAVLDSGSWLTVDGHVEAVGFDIVDHIEFEASEPIEIDFTLEGFGPFADLDVSIYDPIEGVILGTYAIGGPFESGTIIVHDPGRPFQFVIEAFDQASAWTLELEAFPHVCGCFASLNSGEGGDELDSPLDLDPEQAERQAPAAIVLKRLPGEVRSRDEQFPVRDS